MLDRKSVGCGNAVSHFANYGWPAPSSAGECGGETVTWFAAVPIRRARQPWVNNFLPPASSSANTSLPPPRLFSSTGLPPSLRLLSYLSSATVSCPRRAFRACRSAASDSGRLFHPPTFSHPIRPTDPSIFALLHTYHRHVSRGGSH
jgi:hypothetical protein